MPYYFCHLAMTVVRHATRDEGAQLEVEASCHRDSSATAQPTVTFPTCGEVHMFPFICILLTMQSSKQVKWKKPNQKSIHTHKKVGFNWSRIHTFLRRQCWGCVSVVESFPRVHTGLASIPSTEETNKTKKENIKGLKLSLQSLRSAALFAWKEWYGATQLYTHCS